MAGKNYIHVRSSMDMWAFGVLAFELLASSEGSHRHLFRTASGIHKWQTNPESIDFSCLQAQAKLYVAENVGQLSAHYVTETIRPPAERLSAREMLLRQRV